jgi:hypothetical protein
MDYNPFSSEGIISYLFTRKPMQKTISLLILISFILTGCTFPAASTTAEPTPDLIATQVAIQLTQQPAPTNIPDVAKPTEPLPAATVTSQPAKPTVAATSTSAASTPTSTSTIAPSVTTPPTETPNSSDPIVKLGSKAVWKDTFQNGKGWGLEGNPYDDTNTRVEVKNNALILTSYGVNGWHGWRLSYLNPLDFYLEAEIRTTECASSDLYGLMFRATDSQSGYWYGVTCDGRFNLRSGDVNNFEDIAAFKKSDAILAGSNQTNRLGVWVKGSKISLYANGKLIGEFNDTAFPDSGKFGLFIARQKTATFVIQCTQIAYWNVP